MTNTHAATGRPAKARIYARSALEDDQSIERQKEACRRYAQAAGLTVAGTYVDNGRSAYRGRRRRGFEQMLKDMRAGQFDVITFAMDRLARNPRDIEKLIDIAEATGCQIHGVQNGKLTDNDRLIVRFSAAVANQEARRRSEAAEARRTAKQV